MTDVVAPPHPRRLPFWAMVVALVISALGGVFALLWFKLPTWKPEWVVEHSPWLDPLLRAVVEDRTLDAKARQRVVEWGPPMKERLRQRLQDPEHAIRGLAAAALGHLKDDDAIDALVLLLHSDKEQECRIDAAEALGRIGNPRGVAPLIKVLRQKDGILTVASNALTDLPSKDVAEALLPLLLRNEGNQPTVIRLAGKIDDERMVAALENIVREPLPEGARTNIDALKTTRQVLAASQLATSPNENKLPRLLVLLSEPDEAVLFLAMSGLVLSGIDQLDGRLTAPIINALEARSEDVRLMAALTIRQFNIPEAHPRLRKMLMSPDAEIRHLAVSALGSRGANDDIVALLVERLQDDDSLVRASTIVALGGTGNPTVLDSILELHGTADKRSRRTIYYLVTRSPYNREAKVFPYLLLGLADSSETVSSAAHRVLRALNLSDEQRRQVDAVIAGRVVDSKPAE